MLDIGWSELLVIGVVALIVVGPKDLPVMFRRLGQFTGRARAMAREFTSAMDKAADEAGVSEVQKDLRKIANPRKMGLDALNDATSDLGRWNPDAASARSQGPGKDTGKAASASAASTLASAAPGSETAKLAASRAEASEQLRVAADERRAARAEGAPAPAATPAQPSASAPDQTATASQAGKAAS